LAYIRSICQQRIACRPGEKAFKIIESEDSGRGGVCEVTADTAACAQCVAETFASDDRRHGYGLTNCTNCGPRFSIIRRVPYDRHNTTMAGFEMCPACRAEYTDPADRRFHAQPIACHDCGPRVTLVDRKGQALGTDPIATARSLLWQGRIVAIKGLGGFHIAVRGDDQSAVLRLRQLKKRDHKPLALMVSSIEEARRLVELGRAAVGWLTSPWSPIVLGVRRRQSGIAESVAPGTHRLGLMLPYTPIHHLLLRGGEEEMPPLVMTSGNVCDEPLAIDNGDALRRLGPLCDAILWHGRPIERGVDDSVIIDAGEDTPIFVRRSRGYAPAAIELVGAEGQEGICVGGELKNAVAIVRDGAAILSQHLGDLSHPRAFENFRRTIDDMRQLFGVPRPRWIAHDMHPMYLSTSHATRLARELGVPAIGVQHHHAHAAAVMAEHGIAHRILAVVCDGTGYGTDGSIWGGELLVTDRNAFERLAHLRSLRLAGGDTAARETDRCALALLYQALGNDFADHPAARRLVPQPSRRRILARMIADDIASAHSSGAGRVFDGVAALLGLCSHNHFEAQAALALEAAAHVGQPAAAATQSFFAIADDSGEIDLSPLMIELLRRMDHCEPVEDLALLFHEQFARAWEAAVVEAARRTQLKDVALSGGVFCNSLLARRLSELLERHGLRVLRQQQVPPNDGGIALGQAAVACARVRAGLKRSDRD
jgi:hydrogenase maturation protein HypF